MKEFIIPEGYILEKETATKEFGRFTISPFERGFGHTLGNSLRRILLSSIPGCAVSGIKIQGVSHEFTTIFGVKEDVAEIVLNFKKLNFWMDTDERTVLILKTKDRGPVYGKDIELKSGITLANPNQYLFTLDKPKKLEIQIEVTKGRGFVPVEEREIEEYGFIPIDADYSPVKKVAYFVENTRVKRITNYDKLIMEITTDGSITPEDALKESARILRKCANVFVPMEEKEAIEQEKTSIEVLEEPVEVLGLSNRILNSLKAQKILKLKDLCKYSQEELKTFPNFGEKSLEELKKALKDFSKKEGIEVKLK